MSVTFHLFLPQMRLSIDALVARAQAAEASGFEGMALIDHLQPPMAAGHPMYEALTASTWLAARTERLRHGHLVLCDSFRHPAVLAMAGVTLDHASQGRYELGIGWGSVPSEIEQFGVFDTAPKVRVARLAETLEIVTALWRGETVDFKGQFFQLSGASQQPTPLTKIPILIGGSGPKTMALVAKYADWWNSPLHQLDQFERARAQAGNARVSLQQMVSLVRKGQDRAEVEETTRRRFGANRPVIGDASELVDHFGQLAAGRGMERFYVWFADFAAVETLQEFGETVIAPLSRA